MEREVQGYLTELGMLRAQMREAAKGLNDEAASWRPLLHDTNSIYALFAHLIGVDNLWIRQMIGGEPIKRDLDAEFGASGSLADVMERWEKASQDADAILGKLSPSQLTETRTVTWRPGLAPLTVQWIILHVISHYATHLGHMQLTRQLWDERFSK